MSAEHQEKPKRSKMKRCGMGCAIVLLFILILAFVVFLFRDFFCAQLRASLEKSFARQYESAKERQKLSPSEEEVFYDLMTSIQRRETTVSVAAYACILLERCLTAPNDALRKKIVDAATDMRELLDVTPTAGIREVMDTMEKYPELRIGNWKSANSPAPAPQS